MIQKCPNCGQWCETEKQGFWGRAGRGFAQGAEASGKVGEKIGGIFGKKGKKIGNILGAFGGGYTGIPLITSTTEALAGDAYQFCCPNCGHEWGTDDPDDDQTEEYNEFIAQQERNDAVIELRDTYPSLIHASKQEQQNFIKQLLHELNDEENTPAQAATLYDTLAASYQLVGDKNRALQAADSSLKIFDDDNTRVMKGLIMGVGRNVQDTYAAMQEVIHYRNERDESPYYPTSTIEEEFSKLQSAYAQNFLSLPENQRKHLVICDELVYLPQSFRVLPLSEIPTDIKFPPGHPVNDTLYVRHPYKSDTYFPYDSYDIEILRDEICEFSWIMDCLGAKHIDFIDTIDDGVENTEHTRRDIHGNGDFKGMYGGSAGYESEKGSEAYRKLHNELGQSKDFEPGSTPHIPRDVVWYSHRIEWQRNCQSRLEGRLLRATFTLATSSSEMTSETERKKIEADLKILLVKVGGGKEGEKSFSLKKEHAHTWKVNVEFYPLSEYDKKSIPVVSSLTNNVLTTSETPKRKIGLNWILGIIIAALAAVILCLFIVY